MAYSTLKQTAEQQLADIRAAGLYKTERTILSPQNTEIRVTQGQVINLCANNYLGLANHPEVRKADADAAAQFGLATPMGARMMSGNTNYHEQ